MSIDEEYDQTIDWLYNLHLFGIKFGLKKVEKLLEYLGNPQDKLRIIHVGGTNGKGSVCAMLGSILENAGYKVGVNTSPHLSEFTERITINGQQITKADVINYAKLLKEIREKVNSETHLGYATYFEVVTAMALKYFYDSDLDFVILEVGLGGTFDATNVVKPMLTVITDVSLDHTEHLGVTLTSVAENKAGIIKPGCPVVTSNTQSEVLNVISQTCETQNSTCYVLEKDFNFKINSSTIDGLELDYSGIEQNYQNLKIPLLGEHQGKNAALAISALEILQNRTSVKLSEQVIRKGFLKTRWPGRLEIIQKSPWVIVDGAHNPSGAKTLAETLKLFDYDKMHLVFGCSEEKDIKNLLKDLAPMASRIILTQAGIRRAAKPELIFEQLQMMDIKKWKSDEIKIETSTPVSTAVENALAKTSNNDLVCICGSLFVVGEAREVLLNNDVSREQITKRIHY
jgi:dihydrofolate synthase/folylpolyglutamate synthase